VELIRCYQAYKPKRTLKLIRHPFISVNILGDKKHQIAAKK